MERPTPFAPWYSTGVNQLARAGADVPYLGASGVHLPEQYLPAVPKKGLLFPTPNPSHTVATAVSADGSVVVGRGKPGTGVEGFQWTLDGGMVGLGDLAGGGGTFFAGPMRSQQTHLPS
jgi:probable HAF family extracellular repeat protein